MISAPKLDSPYRALLVMAVFHLTLIVGYLGHQGFAPMTAIAGVLGAPLLRPRHLPKIGPQIGLGLILALVAWTAVTMRWSPYVNPIRNLGDLEAITALKLLVQAVFYSSFVAAAAGLSARDARTASIVLAASVVASAGVLLIESLSGAALYQAMNAMVGSPIARSTAMIRVSLLGDAVVLLMWPASLTLSQYGQSRWLVLAPPALIAGWICLSADAQLAALAAGTLAWLLWRWLGRRLLGPALALSWIYWLATPMLISTASRTAAFGAAEGRAPPSWAARMQIWTFAERKIAEKPLLGWGLDASRTWPGVIPLHTHDAAMQVWLELGLVGAVLTAALWSWLLWQVARDDDDNRAFCAAAFAALVTYSAIGAVSFGIWQEWWLALGALTFAALAAARRWLPDYAETDAWLTGSVSGGPTEGRAARLDAPISL